MDTNENYDMPLEGIGSVKISEEVVGIIAGAAVAEAEGVSSMVATISGGIAERLLKNQPKPNKGIKVTFGENEEAVIDISVIVDYGCNIPKVATAIQEKVKTAVETMAGIAVSKVNIHIQGVNLDSQQKKD